MPNIGFKHSEESKAKIKESLAARKVVRVYTCPYCNSEFTGGPKSKFCSRQCANKFNNSTGRPHTEQSKHNIAKSRMGDANWSKKPEVRAKISAAKKGKILLHMRGKKHPWNAKELNHNWKGGITPENIRIRTSVEYAEWRRKIYERDSYVCKECGQVGGKLNAHHIKSFSEHPDLRFDISNGVTLCESCHKKTDGFLKKRGNRNK